MLNNKGGVNKVATASMLDPEGMITYLVLMIDLFRLGLTYVID